MALVTQEKGVLKDLYIVLLDLELVEIIHVELSDEGRKVVVFEVLGQDVIAKGLLLNDLESISVDGPGDDIRRFVALHDLEEFYQKGRDMVHICSLGVVHVIVGMTSVD